MNVRGHSNIHVTSILDGKKVAQSEVALSKTVGNANL
jgi:hypothetical protein